MKEGLGGDFVMNKEVELLRGVEGVGLGEY
jgi:hypothetical protein